MMNIMLFLVWHRAKLGTLGAFKANSLRMTVSKSSFFTMFAGGDGRKGYKSLKFCLKMDEVLILVSLHQ